MRPPWWVSTLTASLKASQLLPATPLCLLTPGFRWFHQNASGHSDSSTSCGSQCVHGSVISLPWQPQPQARPAMPFQSVPSPLPASSHHPQSPEEGPPWHRASEMFQNIEILLLSEVKAKRLILYPGPWSCITNPSDYYIFKGKQHKSYPDHGLSHFWILVCPSASDSTFHPLFLRINTPRKVTQLLSLAA